MTQKEFDIDLLKALSIIEGAVRASNDRRLEEVVVGQLDWIVNSITTGLKGEPNERRN